MNNLINLNTYPIWNVLDILLQDKTTKKNIIWAAEIYTNDGIQLDPKKQITKGELLGYESLEIQPRVFKTVETQAGRTKKKAEVMTPSWLCNKMNNYADREWFGRENVFNTERDNAWAINKEKIYFPENKTWKDYVELKMLEITCGEAPYLVSRYDTTTGNMIPIEERIGILDRKLRVVNENTESEEDWIAWAKKAFQTTYGYEYQGDSLLIARINLLCTFTEYYEARWGKQAEISLLKVIANIIAWNIWQMDGLTGTVPLGLPVKEREQLGFDLFGDKPAEEERSEPSRIYDWKANKSITYNSIKRMGD